MTPDDGSEEILIGKGDQVKILRVERERLFERKGGEEEKGEMVAEEKEARKGRESAEFGRWERKSPPGIMREREINL